MAVRSASATWKGGLKGGTGSFAGESGLLSGAYNFGSRFGTEPGTNPEEMVGAAHAACFSMALAGGLERAGAPATEVTTTAKVTIEKVGDAFRITGIALTSRAKVPGIAPDTFATIATATKTGCPISAALGAVQITLDAQLA